MSKEDLLKKIDEKYGLIRLKSMFELYGLEKTCKIETGNYGAFILEYKVYKAILIKDGRVSYGLAYTDMDNKFTKFEVVDIYGTKLYSSLRYSDKILKVIDYLVKGSYVRMNPRKELIFKADLAKELVSGKYDVDFFSFYSYNYTKMTEYGILIQDNDIRFEMRLDKPFSLSKETIAKMVYLNENEEIKEFIKKVKSLGEEFEKILKNLYVLENIG